MDRWWNRSRSRVPAGRVPGTGFAAGFARHAPSYRERYGRQLRRLR
nr:hypothetical protein [Streptomyces sp. S1D4-11]QIZ00961.1 hypothetical protein HEP87_53940 [Streptomyces sp. S1D4-11]